MSCLNSTREEAAGSERAVLMQAPFPMSHKSSLAAASVYLIGIRLGAMWIAEDGKYVSDLLLCPTTDLKAWELSCWSPVLLTSSFLSVQGPGARSAPHSLPEAVLCSSPSAPLHPPLNPKQKHCLATLAGQRGGHRAGGAGHSRKQPRVPQALGMTHIIQATKEA